MLETLLLTFAARPPVVANLIAFALIASAERGVARMLLWLASGTAIGWLMELSSTRTGFPFGSYEYHAASFRGELSLGGVPIFASLSFAALTYFGFSVACTLLSPLQRRAGDVRRVEDPRLAGSPPALALAAVLVTWMDLVMDPVTLLGRYWHLGDLYHYDPPGSHFGVPLANYFGWLFTSFAIVACNQQIDRALAARGRPARAAFTLPFSPFWALGATAGTYLHMLAVTGYLAVSPHVPPRTPVGAILLSGVFFTAAYAVFAGLLLRRGFRLGAGQVPTTAGARARAPSHP